MNRNIKELSWFQLQALEPVMKVMQVVEMGECLPQVTSLRHVLQAPKEKGPQGFRAPEQPKNPKPWALNPQP